MTRKALMTINDSQTNGYQYRRRQMINTNLTTHRDDKS